MTFPKTPLDQIDFKAGTTLLVDKPLEWTSFDVVNKIRFRLKHLLGVKKIKVGHAGTLDPLATGLLIICTGKSTKKLETYQAQEKTYTGTISIGATTPSFDKETEINQRFPIDHLHTELIEKARQLFIGAIEQYPPMYSAIKVDGQPLYKKARKGQTVEVKPRPVEIFEFSLNNWQAPNDANELASIDFKVRCSKGTYIRSLAYDFGKALDAGAHLSALCRTAIGEYQLTDAWNLDQLIEGLEALPKKPIEN